MGTRMLFRWMIVLFSALLAAAPAYAENVSFTVNETAKTHEKVIDIDHQARKVTLQDAAGKVRTITVAENVSNLNRVGTGDEVTIETKKVISVEVQPGQGQTMNIGSESQTGALPGEKPKGIRTIEGKLKTRVENIDYTARTLTFKNRKGVLRTYQVGPQVTRFNEIQRGDMLVVDYSETLTLSVQ